MMPPYKKFTLAAVSWLVGVGIGEMIPLSFFIIFFLCTISSVSVLAIRNSLMQRIAYSFSILLFGILYALLRQHTVSETSIDYYNGSVASISGRVSAEPDVRATHTKVTVSDIMITGKSIDGKILLLVNSNQQAAYGNSIHARCKLEAAEKIESFAYDKYLARFGIYSICAFPKELTIENTPGKPPISWLLAFKRYLEGSIDRSIAEPEASLLAGILLGNKRGLPADITDAFQRTGLSHIVALSGYNISVLIGFVLVFGPYLLLSRKALVVVTGLLILAFTIMTGSSASVVRAGMMGWLLLLAYEVRRLPYSNNILLGAAVVMVGITPAILIYDIGWQLSFMATFGMLVIAPELQYRFRKIGRYWGIRDAVLMTCTAMATTMPLIIWHFSGVSLSAIPANIAVVPVIPFVMAGGLLTAVAGTTPISFVWTVPTEMLLRYMIAVSTLLSGISVSYISVPEKHQILATSIATCVLILALRYVYTHKTT